MRKILLPIALLGLTAQVCFGQTFGTPTVDGTADAALYGTALSVQTQNTSFGNSDGSFLPAEGSGGGELDALHMTNDANNLYVMITGNVEPNGNLVLLMVDSPTLSSGESGLFDGIDGGDGYFQPSASGNGIGGTTFPDGFELDYLFGIKFFDDGSDGTLDWRFQDADLTLVVTDVYGNFDTGATTHPATDTQEGISFGLNNSNSAGVSGIESGNPATYPTSDDPAAVTTGLEFSLPLSKIGNPTAGQTISVLVGYMSADANFWSNQSFGPWSDQDQSALGDHLGTDPDLGAELISPVDFTILAAGPTPSPSPSPTPGPNAAQHWEAYE